MGDVKMLAMIGAFLGWPLMVLTLILASFSGAVFGVAMIVSGRGGAKAALPFGTFLAVGALVAAVAGEPIVDWYLGFYPMKQYGLRPARADRARRAAGGSDDVCGAALRGGARRMPSGTCAKPATETALLSAALQDAVTKLKAQERAMNDRAVASEQLSAQIVESLTAGLLVVDRTGTIEIFNPAGRTMLEIAADPVGGDYRGVLDMRRSSSR